LCEWLEANAAAPHMLAPEVFAFEKVGVAQLRVCYTCLVRQRGIDAIVLVDGGTDMLMRGDEVGPLGASDHQTRPLCARENREEEPGRSAR